MIPTPPKPRARSRCAALLAITAELCLTAPAQHAHAQMIIQGYSPQQHDRFYTGTDKDFIGDPFDWSGVGRTEGRNPSPWGTLISPSFLVTANHFGPNIGNKLRFFHTNDPNGTSESRQIESTQQISGSDLRLIKLTAPVSSAVAFYPIIKLPSDDNYQDREIFTFGLSDDPQNFLTNVRLGRNKIQSQGVANFIDSFNVSGTIGRALTFTFDTPGIPGESKVQDFDSGAPDFALYGNTPALVGINWFLCDPDRNPPCESLGSLAHSGSTFLPFYIDLLNAAMAASGESVTALTPTTGDATLDGFVDIFDLATVISNLGNTSTTWTDGDFNDDNTVNFLDYILAIQNLTTNPTQSLAAQAESLGLTAVSNFLANNNTPTTTTTTPEPNTALILTTTLFLFLSRRTPPIPSPS